jgi:predicted HTH transcriptional regulator
MLSENAIIKSTAPTAQKEDENCIENKETTQKTVQESDNKATRKQPENNQKTTRKQPENISDLIIETIKTNDNISRSEMAKQLNITEGSLRHHLEQLKIKGIIRRDGSDKGGKWVIIVKE